MYDQPLMVYHLKISGMTCATCAIHVRRALYGANGVIKVDLDNWRDSIAYVTVRLSTNPRELVRVLRESGYDATVEMAHPMTDNSSISDNHSFDYDLIVLGSGAAGVAASIQAAELGYSVAIIEKNIVGGTCVNIGCIPSKALFRVAQYIHHAKNPPFDGVLLTLNEVSWPVIRTQKDDLISELRMKKYFDVLAAYSKQITLLYSSGTLLSDGVVQLDDGSHLSARRIIIATGARPLTLDIPGIDKIEPLTSTSLMELDTLPQSLLIVGGRTVSVELGQIMARLGVNVTIIQRSKSILPDYEPEIRDGLAEILRKEGINIVTGAKILSVDKSSSDVVLQIRVEGESHEYRAERLMFAAGRVSNTDDIGLENVGITLDDHGSIIVDSTLQTSNPNIYAAGDVTILPKFVYVAAAAGQTAARNALSSNTQPMDLSVLPKVIFTDPQVATVGLTEAEAKREGFNPEVGVLPLSYVPRNITAHDTRGLIKVVADRTTRRLLGVSILAAEAGEAIQSAAFAILMGRNYGLTIDSIRTMFFPYLTLVEGLKLALLSLDFDVSKLSCCAG